MSGLFIPKGSMCGSCENVSQNCSTLDFKSMKAIKKHNDGTVVVKCSHFSTGTKKPLILAGSGFDASFFNNSLME